MSTKNLTSEQEKSLLELYNLTSCIYKQRSKRIWLSAEQFIRRCPDIAISDIISFLIDNYDK